MEPPLDTVTPEGFRRIRQVFEAALERPQAERRAFVEAACGSDAGLRAEIDRMLAAEEELLGRLDDTARTGVHPAEAIDESRFDAGTLFAGRFRIVARLGHGGMGEVYRADDLELGQRVALKFLTAFRSDARARARLRTEVRLARQISHPNVCRVYDIGEAGGELYLSMEYVDGEDLASLLKRIGRVPIDKGVEIARKLCAGLAAAHAQGVLHRDFKPANIMIDASGEIRILDFGLSAIADDVNRADVRSGTPAYMAPEQLAGREATAQSDIYALGLVLYELFTGKAPFEAKTPQEFLRFREDSHPARPSTLIPELGERVEQAILRCLDPDPKMRPMSPLHVSAVLPGGDPLAEALAAGETPSPEMVAAAGATDTLSLRAAIALVTCAVAGLAAICVLTSKVQTLAMIPLDASPETLAVRARDIIQDLGYPDRRADFAFGFQNEEGYFDYVRATPSSTAESRLRHWSRILAAGPSPVSFWYRQSPTPLIVESGVPGPDNHVSLNDPFPGRPGMISVVVDLNGRLRRFTAVPRDERTPQEPGPPDWSSVFAAAGLDMVRFNRIAPESTPLVISDTQAAWTGTSADRPELSMHVEAVAFRGQVTLFDVRYPWTAAHRWPESPQEPVPIMAQVTVLFLLAASALAALSNLNANRGDVRGAWRIAGAFGCLFALRWILLPHHGTAAWMLTGLQQRVIPVFFTGCVLFAFGYLAIEPWVRRYWPQTMITWSRFLAGQWRDPVVGRDFLLGVVLAVGHALLLRSVDLGAIWLGAAPARPASTFADWGVALDTLMGNRAVVGEFLFSWMNGFGVAAQTCFLLFLFRLLLRKPVLAAASCFILFLVLSQAQSSESGWSPLVLNAIAIAFSISVLLRLGLLAMMVFCSMTVFIDRALLTIDFTAWYGQGSLLAVIVVSAIALWSARASLGDRLLVARASLDH